MKKSLGFSLFLLISMFGFSIISVSALEVSYTPVQADVLIGDYPKYIIHIVNNEGGDLVAQLKVLDLVWVLEGTESVVVPSGETTDVNVAFKPFGDTVAPGRYGIILTVQTAKTTVEKVIRANVLDYDGIIDADFISLPEIDPRRSNIIKLELKNEYSITLNDLDVEVKTDFFSLKKDIDLDPYEDEVSEFEINLDPNLEEGMYPVFVKVMLDDHVMVDKQFSLKIARRHDIREIVESVGWFLNGGERIIKINEGNTVSDEVVTKKFGFIGYKLFGSNPEPTGVKKADGVYTVTWRTVLAPGEEMKVEYHTAYWLLFLGLLVIAAIFVVGYTVRQKNIVDVHKRVLTLRNKEGNIEVMKVLLNVRNRGKRPISFVRVMDRVPSSIKAPDGYGMLRPNAVKSEPTGTRMVWDLGGLRGKEEKVISYKVESRIPLIGKLRLPSAIARYMHDGRNVVARAGGVSLKGKKKPEPRF